MDLGRGQKGHLIPFKNLTLRIYKLQLIVQVHGLCCRIPSKWAMVKPVYSNTKLLTFFNMHMIITIYDRICKKGSSKHKFQFYVLIKSRNMCRRKIILSYWDSLVNKIQPVITFKFQY